MTENQIRNKVVSTAKQYLGHKESDGSHKKIIDIYNGHKPLAMGYKVKYSDEWCATTVSAVSILCGLTDIMPTECSCSRMITLYKKLGRWKESDSYKPSIGDIVMYDWDDNGKGDNVGFPEHTGIVANVSGDTMVIIEGNKNQAVAYRTMKINSKYIRGYCLPDYKSKVIKNEIDTIKEVQKWINTNYKFNLVVDGIYGAKTKKALVKALQNEINQTYNGKLKVDGIWGIKTKAACPTLKKGTKNDVVKVLQALLICNRIPDVCLNGIYEDTIKTAVKSYQKKKKLIIDGIAGKNTFAKLCS